MTLRFLQDEAEHFDLQTRYEVDDAKLQRLVHDLADEVQAGLPNGALYADGLTLALYGWLLRHYAAAPTARRRGRAESLPLRAPVQDQLRLPRRTTTCCNCARSSQCSC